MAQQVDTSTGWCATAGRGSSTRSRTASDASRSQKIEALPADGQQKARERLAKA
jgi:hypothetical protein